MKAKTGYIKYDSEYNMWEFKKEINSWEADEWTRIVYFELENE